MVHSAPEAPWMHGSFGGQQNILDGFCFMMLGSEKTSGSAPGRRKLGFELRRGILGANT